MEPRRTYCRKNKRRPGFLRTKWRRRFLKLANGCCGRFSSVAEVIITHSSEETMNWGREFAKRLTAPVLVMLTGELGSGKTTLTKGIVAGLGVAREEEVTSP